MVRRTMPRKAAPAASSAPSRILLAGNPGEADDESLGVRVNREKWWQLNLRAPKNDGSWADVTLLRPLGWLKDQQTAKGRLVHI